MYKRQPEAPTSILTSFLDSLRRGVQAFAEYQQTGHVAGRPTKKIKDDCDFEIIALQPGSLRVGIQVPTDDEHPMFDPEDRPVIKSLRIFLQVAEWISTNGNEAQLNNLLPDPTERKILLNAVKAFLPRKRGDVEFVEMSGRYAPSIDAITLRRDSHAAVDRALDSTSQVEVVEYKGDLREIDLDNLTFKLRNIDDVTEVRCKFDASLLDTAKEALDRHVAVSGSLTKVAGGRNLSSLTVIRLDILESEPNQSAESDS